MNKVWAIKKCKQTAEKNLKIKPPNVSSLEDDEDEEELEWWFVSCLNLL